MILETFCRDFKEEVQKRVYFYKSSRLASSGIIRIGAGARSGDARKAFRVGHILLLYCYSR